MMLSIYKYGQQINLNLYVIINLKWIWTQPQGSPQRKHRLISLVMGGINDFLEPKENLAN